MTRSERAAARTHTFPLVGLSYLLIGLAALLPRVLDLGRFITADEANFWMARSARFLQALQSSDYLGTALSTHPGVTTTWLGSAGILLHRALLDWGLIDGRSFATRLALMQLPVALLHTAGVLLGYALLRRMLPAGWAVLAALLWACDPFVIAYSRLLHVDALAGTCITVSLLAACRYWFYAQKRGTLVLSGICAGLALLSKSPALALLPVVGGVALLAAQQPRDEAEPRAVRSRLSGLALPLLAWGLICALTVFALWPALWVNPVAAYEQIRIGVEVEGAQPHLLGNFFLGQEDLAPGPLYYPVAMALRLTPWAMLGVLLLPLFWGRIDARERRMLATLAGYAILFSVALSFFPKKFDRYLEPIFPALDILAAAGLYRLAHSFRRLIATSATRSIFRLPTSVISRGLMGAIAVAALINVAWWHPYSIAAANPLFGGAQAGAETFRTGWGEGLEQAATWLNQQPDITGVLAATTHVPQLQRYLIPGAQSITPPDATLPEQTGYVVIYIDAVQTGRAWPPFDQFYGRVAPVHTVRIHSVDYAWIYQVPPRVAQPLRADFGDAIQLRGFETSSAAQRGQPLRLKLFWQASAAPERDYMLFAHLIGPDGQRATQADLPYPTGQWEAGRYYTTELVLPPVRADAPPGNYRLSLGLYDAANGQRLPLRTTPPPDPTLNGPDALLLMQVELR